MFRAKQYLTLGVLAVFMGATLSACTSKPKADTPAAVLQAYVTTAINAKTGSDKIRLYEYVTGKALERLQKMTDEDFVNNLIKPQFKFVHFSSHDQREENDGLVSLVYELVFENGAGENSTKITNRKIAYLKKDGGMWKIDDTRNVKSFMEMKDGLNVQYP